MPVVKGVLDGARLRQRHATALSGLGPIERQIDPFGSQESIHKWTEAPSPTWTDTEVRNMGSTLRSGLDGNSDQTASG